MKSRQILKHTAICLGLGVVLGMSVPALAQGRGGRGNGQGGIGGFGTQGAGQNGLGGQRMGQGRTSRQNDPSRSSIQELLHREDVRAHLYLNGRQKEQFDSLSQQAQADWQTQMQASRANRSSLRGLSPEERQAKMQEMQDQRQSALQAFQNQEESKVAAILTPQQMKRLSELDLQWRGPFALSDPKVAEKVGLNPEQVTQVEQQLTDYRTMQRETMRAQFAGLGGRGGNAQAGAGNAQTGQTPVQSPQPGGTPPPLDAEAMQQRMTDAQKAIEKGRKVAGDKVVALLTHEQQQTWKTLQGPLFTFRTAN